MVQLRNLLWGLLPASDSPSQSSEGDSPRQGPETFSVLDS